MPKLGWPEFSGRHKRGHLLVAVLPEEGPPGNVREHINLLAKLLSRLAKGDYALNVNRQGETPEIHCAFERDSDVEVIAYGVAAQPIDSGAGWASQRAFRMDQAAFNMIKDALDEV